LAAINMSVHVSLLYVDLHSIAYVLKNHIAGSYSSSSFRFLFLDSYSGWINLHLQQQCIRYLFSCILANICCCFFWWQQLWLGWDGISVTFWFACPLKVVKDVERFFMYLWM
jgi:hypothetical protein